MIYIAQRGEDGSWRRLKIGGGLRFLEKSEQLAARS